MAKNKHNAKVGSTVERSDDRIKETGEVFTPMQLVYDMIADVPTEVLADNSKTYLDNSCGSGNFLFGLLQVLTGEVTLPGHPTYKHDKQHVLDHQLYGVDFMEDNIKETRKRLGVPDSHCHYVWADALAYDYSFTSSTWSPNQTNDLSQFFIK